MSIDRFEASFHCWHWWALAMVPVFLRRWSEVYTKIVWLDFPLIIAMYRGNPGYVTPCYWRSISQKSRSFLTSDQYDVCKFTTVKRILFQKEQKNDQNLMNEICIIHLIDVYYVTRLYTRTHYRHGICQKFTQPDFQVKNFTPQKRVNCDIFLANQQRKCIKY